jgi:serine protease Do
MSKVGALSAAVASVAVSLWLPGTAAAQAGQRSGGSVLWLPPAAGKLAPGADARGSLSSADYKAPNDAYFDAWELEGQVGGSLTLDLKSDDFDSFLYVVGPGLEETLSDDDGGGGCHARITLTFLEAGTFRVIATSAGAKERGVYTLRASATPEPVVEGECGGPDPAALRDLPTADRRLRVGDRVTGALASTDRELPDGTHAQAWALEGKAGETVNVLLESDDFDSYLYLTGPGIASPMKDDDSGGELHARITVTFPETGTYVAVVNTATKGATGVFRLSARRP